MDAGNMVASASVGLDVWSYGLVALGGLSVCAFVASAGLWLATPKRQVKSFTPSDLPIEMLSPYGKALETLNAIGVKYEIKGWQMPTSEKGER